MQSESNHQDGLEPDSIAFLRRLQSSDGGFREDPEAPLPSVASTNMALRALRLLGGAPDHPSRTLAFVCEHARSEAAAFANTDNDAPSVKASAMAVMAIAELASLQGVQAPALLPSVQQTIDFMYAQANGPVEYYFVLAAVHASGLPMAPGATWYFTQVLAGQSSSSPPLPLPGRSSAPCGPACLL
ncbi:hypothetical protein WKW80_33170 [Variovorax humicola]|uniref:Prenyltransferase and squalene oxidase repeat protein n=1 Tax=Variovorax humicola TaxID=1769758 RepID=A0ABU8W9T2_9BURK